MKIEELIGLRAQRSREEQGISQPEMGRLLEPLLGSVWPRQTVSAAERGKRAWASSELFAFAHVLQVPVGHLMAPTAEVDEIELASGAKISVKDLDDEMHHDVTQESLGDMARVISDLRESNARQQGLINSLALQVDEVHEAWLEKDAKH
ncbi:helix-turn-helix transcriptional regulator [Rhodococcus fascians]|nr:helix-turn-helix transcriptional regulator [Rhodococcus fascians]MBY3825487.1 helix-turn-helix transcriptional regulator [Rhodococcus fascians]MBY3835949.1 helix-turn-helix transcriptional regulator [Rhodococcus fascians]MBY3865161.1 helix-turn-helix transcriptional regulator [Rhodococcus fascians]MBY3884437.1 helix-turn-helix transcriptional regulator [Rhodococcus fascians]